MGRIGCRVQAGIGLVRHETEFPVIVIDMRQVSSVDPVDGGVPIVALPIIGVPTAEPGGFHVAGIEGILVSVPGINGPGADFIIPNGVDHVLPFGLVIDGPPRTPDLIGHQKSHGHIFIGVGCAVGAFDAAVIIEIPIHHIMVRAIGDPLDRVFPKTIEQGLVIHHDGDEHPVADTFGNGVVPHVRPLNTQSAGQGPAISFGPGVGNVMAVPTGIGGGNRGIGGTGREINPAVGIVMRKCDRTAAGINGLCMKGRNKKDRQKDRTG
jgi:hypothetical protein